jgi:hypothetical protein
MSIQKYQLIDNPFTPSEIASNPEDFFGRVQELRTLGRSLQQGSVAIQGPIGIGKSSFLARARLLMEGFNSGQKSKSVIAVGDKDVHTIDEAARLLLESFVRVDERQKKVKFKLGSIFEIESAEITRFYNEGRHLAILKRIVEEEYLKRMLTRDELLVLAIDEADKCPIPLARLIRSIVTHTQQQGVKRVRFVVCGVSPFFQDMVSEDPGINRFIYKTITLQPLPTEEAEDLIETKLDLVLQSASRNNINFEIEEDIATRIVMLSGGHPHIIQLLGSHLVEHECEDPDGLIDSHDLFNSLKRVCYEDRARVYDATLHTLDLHGMLDHVTTLLNLMPRGFPSRLDRRKAQQVVGNDAIQWLVEHNILSTQIPGEYGLVDEFLRIRFILDEAETPGNEEEIGRLILADPSLPHEEEEHDDDNDHYPGE